MNPLPTTELFQIPRYLVCEACSTVPLVIFGWLNRTHVILMDFIITRPSLLTVLKKEDGIIRFVLVDCY